jgi:hypothetical protein
MSGLDAIINIKPSSGGSMFAAENQAEASREESWFKSLPMLPMPFGGKKEEEGAGEGEAMGGWCCLPECNLSWRERIIAWAFCSAVGLLSNFIATSRAPLILLFPSKFALPYTLGNILSLLSTTFLVGPRRQCSSFAQPVRRAPVACYFGCLLGTLLSAFYFHSAFLTLTFCIAQTVAYVVYCITFIPYGASAMLKLSGGFKRLLWG